MKFKKRWKALLRKLDYLRLELEDAKESIEKYEKEFSDIVSNIESPNPVDQQPDQTSQNQRGDVIIRKPDQVIDERKENAQSSSSDEVASETRPESFKKLWKLIASKTHPDVTKGDPEMSRIYKEANEAWKKSEVEKLLDFVAELEIELPEPDDDLIKKLKNRCELLENELKQITSSPIWEWGNGNKEFRDMMIQGVIERRATRRKK